MLYVQIPYSSWPNINLFYLLPSLCNKKGCLLRTSKLNIIINNGGKPNKELALNISL